MTDSPIIQTDNLHRVYHTGGEDVLAITGITLEVCARKTTVIAGPSGAGKTTLLNLLSGLDNPTKGKVWFNKQDLHALSEAERVTLRREKIGFIFQSFGLLPLLDAAENVGVPLRMQRMERRQREQRVREALEWVGLTQRAHHRAYELSGGEQQRVAIARALASRPQIIMADEPTGQLDTQTGARVLNIMVQLAEDHGITLVIATHDEQVLSAADEVYKLHDGALTD